MAALSGSVPERAARSIAAGCDIALNCWAKMDDMVGIAEQLPSITEAAAQRLERALAATNTPSDATNRQPELLARRDSLLQLAAARA